MSKIPYKAEKRLDDDEDYEIVSFEDFCDKSPAAKTDLLTLNDNINYRLHYESDKSSNIAEGGEPSTHNVEMHTETSLNAPNNESHKKKATFAPFEGPGRFYRRYLIKSVLEGPPIDEDEPTNFEEPRYERISGRGGFLESCWYEVSPLLPIMGSAVVLSALFVAAWWAVGGTLDGSWGDDHYKRLWERAHPENAVKKPSSPTIEKAIQTENRYHDHNNLSTKNKINTTDLSRKKDYNKKSGHAERPVGVLKEVCANVSDNMRFDCHPQENATEKECVKRGCCWRAGAAGGPRCHFPAPYASYRFVNSTESRHGLVLQLARARDAHYPRQFGAVRVDFVYVSDDVLQIKITDAENKRFEPPYPEIPIVSGQITKLKYRVEIDSSAVGFKVIRNSDNVTIVNTQNVGGLILSDKFLQISSLLPTDRVYGLGEKQAAFLNDLQWKTITLFNQDMPPTENVNLYGTHPFYLALEKDGQSHGMALINTNAMDIVLQPTPAITYRTIGGILNFFVLLGPSPQEVVAQYTSLVGRPFLPPYWSLGFHLCKYDYGSLNVTRDVMQRNRDAGIPLDVQWNDLDYMSNGNDFTYDKDKFAGLPEFVEQLHDQGMHYVILVDPGVSASEKLGEYPPFDRGLEMDIFIKNSTNQPFIGKVWNPVSTAWPDFTHPNASAYWKEMFSDFHKIVKYDGAWIDMNEPSNFVSGPLHGACAPERLPYAPAALRAGGLRRHSLCADARHRAGAHYDLHSAHALTEAVATHDVMREIRGRRPFVLSRGSSPGLGRVSGHWSGDVYSRWHDMRMSIPALLSFSLFGVPMMGTDICGFIEDTTPELCKRWMQLGAFYPFSRNHNTNDAKPQDPATLGGEVLSASITALRLRYRLLPVYYSLFVRAHLRGDTVARPLFFEFPSDANVYPIDEQFLIGPNVMITAVMQEGANSTKALFPGKDPWYSLRDGSFLAQNEWKEVADADMVSVRGGAILPLQEPPAKGPVNTAVTRSRPMQLLVAPDANGRAVGELYWDDGDSINTYDEKKYSHIEFSLENNELNSTVQWWGYGVPSVDSIIVLGQAKPIKSVTINNERVDFKYTKNIQVLDIYGCHTCGSKDCNRHDPEIMPEPWTDLQIHKQLDQAIEDFYNTILEQFVNSWYSKITLQPFFVDELRHQLRYASASLLRRALKINYARFICDRLVPCALRHYSVSSAGFKQPVHVAVSNRSAELKYLRCLTETILPYVLKNSECQNSVFRVLVREIFAGWALLSLADVLADPHTLNTLIVLATGPVAAADLPPTPNYKVEFLENFVRQSESVYCARAKLLRIDLELLLNNQEHFYGVLHHLRTTTDIYLLQFYKDIKSFQTRLLSPELPAGAARALSGEARALLAAHAHVPRVALPAALLDELRALLDAGPDCVAGLQTSRALYQAARQSHAALEKIMLPRFMHSEEFYKIFIGPRIPTGYQKQMTKRPQDKMNMLKLGMKLRNAIKSQATDGAVLETMNSDLDDGEGIDNVDILKYLDSLAAEDSMDQDLSAYKVVLTNVECRTAAPPRRGAVRVFSLAAQRVRGARSPSLAVVARSEHDFHLLRSKLLEFHGDALLADLPLPSRRDNSPLETLRYKYEDFLQRLIQINLLQTSELLHLFLTVDGDFATVVQASTLNAPGPDLGNIYQSVAHKLRKEKGQHLENFLRNFLISCDKERYQALKIGSTRDVEEAHEVNEEEAVQKVIKRQRNTRNIHKSIFLNNFDVEPVLIQTDVDYQTTVVGFSQCVMYLLLKVVKARTFVTGIVGNVFGMVRHTLDDMFNAALNRGLCDLLTERRLAHLIRLGHDILFGKKSTAHVDPLKQRELAKQQLLQTIPVSATIAFGQGLPTSVLTAFEVIQCPQLNKQLFYNLLDLCVLELFPELRNRESNQSTS
ncbi:uncharacterized protein LOC126774502 [Nymphalis io]|uniref:uncharacterized protein LOC126774502 n=1 Tax=Inachis io TaxID=171585 RepID=UPI00216A1170|nr:uncharacterized protein LOC126774502 [Nymphalis io]